MYSPFGERDARLRNPKNEKWGQMGPLSPQLWEPVFCYCGAPGGYVTKHTPFFYVCLNCVDTYGRIPLPLVPGTENL